MLHGILNTIKDFVKEKFPMMAGAVDNLFAAATEYTLQTTATNTGTTEACRQRSDSFLDKIS